MSAIIRFAFLFLPVAALATTRFEAPPVEAVEMADTEASTNLVFGSGLAVENRWDMTIEVSGTTTNNVQVEFGRDLDGNGVLGAHEREITVGWDCATWFLRDSRGGSVTRVPDVEGRRRLDWSLTLDRRRLGRRLRSNVFPPLDGATLFNPDWNLVRVVVRGKDAAGVLIRSWIRVNPLLIKVR